jgi:hypothetical protein
MLQTDASQISPYPGSKEICTRTLQGRTDRLKSFVDRGKVTDLG